MSCRVECTRYCCSVLLRATREQHDSATALSHWLHTNSVRSVLRLDQLRRAWRRAIYAHLIARDHLASSDDSRTHRCTHYRTHRITYPSADKLSNIVSNKWTYSCPYGQSNGRANACTIVVPRHTSTARAALFMPIHLGVPFHRANRGALCL